MPPFTNYVGLGGGGCKMSQPCPTWKDGWGGGGTAVCTVDKLMVVEQVIAHQ